jgi:excisionase family DNA binding protein
VLSPQLRLNGVGSALYTPAAAAERLTVSESWLRRKAGQRFIPGTFIGKHLRFTEEDLRAVVAAGSCGPSPRNQAPSRPVDGVELGAGTQSGRTPRPMTQKVPVEIRYSAAGQRA